MAYCLEIAESEPYQDENLESIKDTVDEQRARLAEIIQHIENEAAQLSS